MESLRRLDVLLFINDSLGELDWIQQFVIWGSHNNYKFYVYLNLPGKSNTEKLNLFESYFSRYNNVVLLNEDIKIPGSFSIADRYLNSILRRVSGINYKVFKILRFMTDIVRNVIGKIFGIIIKSPKVDFIFRDYNFKDSFALAALQSKNPTAKICVFPHSTAIQSNTVNTPKNPPKKIKVDLFLENTDLSTQFSMHYKKEFVAVGSPSFDYFETEAMPIANYEKKSLLFITRNCDERFFGINYQNSGRIFDEMLSWAKDSGYSVYVKHHPRDARLDFWRNIQKNYDNVIETTSTLNYFSKEIAFAVCFYTSAGLLFTVRGVPVFDISPYDGDVNKLPFHYLDKDGHITHELVDYGFYGQYQNIKQLQSDISPSFLEKSAKKQINVLNKYFPMRSCQKIDSAIRAIL